MNRIGHVLAGLMIWARERPISALDPSRTHEAAEAARSVRFRPIDPADEEMPVRRGGRHAGKRAPWWRRMLGR